MANNEGVNQILPLIRTANALLGPVAPGACAAVAERLFTSPRRYTPPAREAVAERRGERITLGEGRSGLRWAAQATGSERPAKILAMHGWEGRATQWGPLAELANAAGLEVLAIDGPGHGHSPGSRADLASFARALFDADRRHGPFTAVVGHSMGAGTLGYALAGGLRAERAVLIAGPSSIAGVLRRFSGFVGLPGTVERRFFDRMEARVGIPAESLDVAEFSVQLPTLIVHSRDDRDVPFAEAEAIAGAWPRAELLALDGLGHRRILRDPEVLAAVVGFLADGPGRAAQASSAQTA